jgi:hypothetical protein
METDGIQQQPEAGLPMRTRAVTYMANAFKKMIAFIWQNHFEHMAFLWHPFLLVKLSNKTFSCQNFLRIGANHFRKENNIFSVNNM